jgi:hypothetical protein
MSSLERTQDAFAAALRDADRALPEFLTSQSSAYPERRFNVYRNNVMSILTAALKAQFPVVARLVGDDFFRDLARAYVQAELPRTPVLLAYGEGFGDFLDGFAPVAGLPYLGDVARLEWLQARAFHAKDAPALQAEDVGGLAFCEPASVELVPHPSLGMLRSAYPVVEIWRTNAHDRDVAAVDLTAGGDDVIVVRPRLDVVVLRAPPGALEFLTALDLGETYLAAAMAACAAAADFDAVFVVSMMIENGLLEAWRVRDRDAV